MNYKIIFLIFSLFFINNVSAEIIFSENFEKQTEGNFTLTAGNPTFITTPPFDYYLNQPIGTGFTLSIFNNSIQPFTNFSNTFYVRINSQNNYNFDITYCNIGCNQYILITLQNRTGAGNQNNYYIEFWNGIVLDSSNINTINLSNYNDSFGYVKIESKYQNNQMLLYLNDTLINTYNTSVIFSSNFTELYYDVSSAFSFGLDEINLNSISPTLYYTPIISSLTISRLSTCNSTRTYSDIVFPLMGLLLMILGFGTIFVALKSGINGGTIIGSTIFAGVLVAIIGFGLILIGNYLLYSIYNVTC